MFAAGAGLSCVSRGTNSLRNDRESDAGVEYCGVNPCGNKGMSTVIAALLTTLLTSGLTSVVSHQFTIVGGAAAAVGFLIYGVFSRRATLHPMFLVGTALMCMATLISADARGSDLSGTVHVASCYLALCALAISSVNLASFCRQVITFTSLFLTALILGQVLINPALRSWSIWSPSGAANQMAALINMGLPLVLMRIHDTRGYWRLSWLTMLFLNCIAVVCVMSRNGVGSMLIILTAYTLFNYKRLSLVIAAMIVVLLTSFESIIRLPVVYQLLLRFRIVGYQPGTPRSLIWRIAFQHVDQNPWLGVGPGFAPEKLSVIDIYHCHNNIVHVAMETGLPTAVIFSAMMLTLLLLPLRNLNSDRRMFISTLPILAYFSYSWTGYPLGLPAGTLLLAMCVNEARLQQRRVAAERLLRRTEAMGLPVVERPRWTPARI